MTKNRFEKGLETFRQITGDVGEKFVERLRDISPDFADYLIEFPFGVVYSRPGLDIRTRELITLAALTTLGNADTEVRAHIKVALSNRVSRNEIIEVFIQMSVYAGFPAAINSLLIAKEIFDEQQEN